MAFIGAVLKETPTVVTPTGVAGLDFLDEAEAINRQSRRLAQLGIHAQVVLIHQGGTQASYTGPTKPDAAPVSGGILPIVEKLSSEIDVVVSGHAHAFTNALLKNAEGEGDPGHPGLLGRHRLRPHSTSTWTARPGT